ncbi:MAG TPA: lipoyl synthase [Anaeromyxobacteraceae bacterium]|nr:lipoyl synthase [Anaeromyxobacteraceae bacterium]
MDKRPHRSLPVYGNLGAASGKADRPEGGGTGIGIGAKKPPWLRVGLAGGARYLGVRDTLRKLRLHTVCEEARCPNVGECWGGGTATVMLMGDVCTRGCRFCNVKTAAHPPPLDADEPRHLAEAVRELHLDYVVVTSVDRDDLPDGGAAHFAEAILRLKRIPGLLVEVLTPDFRGDPEAVRTVGRAAPDVFANNIETVRRLTPIVRDRKAGYEQTLAVLAQMKREFPQVVTKSSIMVGLGESEIEVEETMRDLRAVSVGILTLGQYLRPSAWHLPVAEWVTPEQFRSYRAKGEECGFGYVASGPLVRSSYRAAELFLRGEISAGSKECEGNDAK